MGDKVNTDCSTKRGEDRRGWHFEKTINMTVVAALLIPTLTGLGAGSWWYMHVERRFSEMTAYDERLLLRAEANEEYTLRLEERLTARLQQDTTRIRADMAEVKAMLTQLFLQTRAPNRTSQADEA